MHQMIHEMLKQELDQVYTNNTIVVSHNLEKTKLAPK
jgi:hypothetical protein